jgi:hypothetical protein
MNEKDARFLFYILTLTVSVGIGVVKNVFHSKGLRLVWLLLALTVLSELLARVVTSNVRYCLYHLYSTYELILITLFFVLTVRPNLYRRLLIPAAIFWISICALNLFLQPITALNTNILLVECVAIIFMSLTAMYVMLMDDSISQMLTYPSFWIWSSFLFLWCATFFFWALFNPL